MTTLTPISLEPLGFSGSSNGEQELFFDPRQAVISQYANSPVMLALLVALAGALDCLQRFTEFFDTVWNIDTATGFGLDIWGRIVGVGRALYIPDGVYLGFSASVDAHSFGDGVFYGAGSATPNYRLTDWAYRQVIMAKAALNITDGSTPAINAILMALFPDYGNVYVRDNNNMTMTVVFAAVPSAVDFAIATQSGVLPRPAGVSLTVELP